MAVWSAPRAFSIFAGVLLCLSVTAISPNRSLGSDDFPLAVMAPLLIETDAGWKAFEASLQKAKTAGFDAVSTDVWIGLVQPDSPDQFKWEYYERLSKTIRKAGLKWIPILSIHACGGNVGDKVNIPLSPWIWTKANRFVSEGSNINLDYVAFWDTPKAMPYYRRYFEAFTRRFASEADNIPEIIVSLGPSGEIHYPSYHHHDQILPIARYPGRGALQASSPEARASFRDAMLAKYGSLDAVNQAWSLKLQSINDILPPLSHAEAQTLFDTNLHSRYSADFFDWYRESLLNHVGQMLDMSSEVFPKSPMRGTRIAVKIPGMHWRMDSRAAELTGGLLSPSDAAQWNDVQNGMGYQRLFETLARYKQKLPLHLYYTAGATPNGDYNPAAASKAQDQSLAIALMAQKYGLPVGIENALACDLKDPNKMGILEKNIKDGRFGSVCLLRVDDAVESPSVLQAVQTINAMPGRALPGRTMPVDPACLVKNLQKRLRKTPSAPKQGASAKN